jgi:hypothetical protein
MSTLKIILLFFLLPMIAPLLYPVSSLSSALLGIILVVILFGALGIMLLRGSSQALTLTIFLLGLNAIIRIMMFFSHATDSEGVANVSYIVTSIVSIALSIYLLLRLDQVDVRTRMVS